MLTISQQQPDIKKIQGEIAAGVGLSLEGDDLLQRGDRLRSRLMQKDSRVLVILDDVWKKVDLKRVGIPSGSDRNYWCKVKAGNSADDPSLPDIAKAVAKECKGLPLAIVTVAGALKGSDEAKDAFLHCSLFEEDSNICTKELLRYGMGLGIFSELENLECARNRVSNLLETLKNCFLLSQVSDKDYVKMHDVVRDMAIHIASEGKHIFLVSHNVNSKEFPRKDSYEQYSHMSIVANKFDERPRPISCPRLKLLMLKFRFKEGFKLQDDFFDGMSELTVISLSGYDEESILPFPSSIQRLSNLSTFWLSNLRLDDVSIIGKLVTLEILSIRDSYLEELPVEIGNLTNLIILEYYWYEGYRKPMRISPGVLSRLVRLEELHMVGVEDCSYSTLRELESLSRLTALTFDECSEDVIYSNLGLSSKLTRYALKVGEVYMDFSIMKTYDKIIALKVSCPNLEELCIKWSYSITALCSHQLPTAYFSKLVTLEVSWCGKLRNLTSPSVVRSLLNLQRLRIIGCQSMEEVITKEEQQGDEIMCNDPLFPRLEKLKLENLPKLGHFILTKQALEFPFLREVEIHKCPEMKTFVQQGSASTKSLKKVNNEDKVKVDDLNEWIHQRFISSKEEDGSKSEASHEDGTVKLLRKKMEANLKIQ
ncbi:hypothetical protein CQW23_25049 [Capsicum baccatum]|uniref:Uncharacterized protein n=1 Tax=Capsicum baccatum TaxID=33114 RepID=A0A2G2VWK8_CAPBA|nr:hypothetical protein CQW23_25049 [Capsicum baccatum]